MKWQDDPKAAERFNQLMAMIMSTCQLAQLVSIEDINWLIQGNSISHALGPIIDPTKYRDGGMDNLEDQQKILLPFLALRKAIEEIREHEQT